MQLHAVIGMGNLGLDIHSKLLQAGRIVHKYSDIESMRLAACWKSYTHIWCAAGGGGPAPGDVEKFASQMVAHVLLPCELMNRAGDNARLIFFSTHYLNEDPEAKLSRYALTKRIMEDTVTWDSRCVVYRVGSLYGRHFPAKTFVGRVVPKLLDPALEHVKLPLNIVVPTPTEWLAQKLVGLECGNSPLPGARAYLVGPAGYTSVFHWGMQLCRELELPTTKVMGDNYDTNYPQNCAVDYSVQSHFEPVEYWGTLWEKYGAPLAKLLAAGLQKQPI